jgi:hypothetical protein
MERQEHNFPKTFSYQELSVYSNLGLAYLACRIKVTFPVEVPVEVEE